MLAKKRISLATARNTLPKNYSGGLGTWLYEGEQNLGVEAEGNRN